ncbi:hypothetical protein GNI_111140 [Gregarina niphandrodes]|uniref:Uncharacterized protein n=1 Tax=Gregarina niphandrodes TaxID=110365 RepID=A0A023B3V5_GRENI|nr:hypothetical protein GNI_111140 [Gregarina niphandrodes]EZG55546.1 hypothetical protein GNI_111140 [Gregarina niphandrodes]|eukprot:XP_011131499.1 hypothetical protein GNI_111140 [Gregarina niphandrodes]
MYRRKSPSAKQEFKAASDKLDALTRKLTLIHRSLVEDQQGCEEGRAGVCDGSRELSRSAGVVGRGGLDCSSSGSGARENIAGPSAQTMGQQPVGLYPGTPYVVRTNVPNEPTDLELKIQILEQKVKDMNQMVIKSIADLRDQAVHETAAVANQCSSILEQVNSIDTRLNKVEQKIDHQTDYRLLSIEHEVNRLDNKCTSIATDTVTESSVQSQRIDSLRRDLDRIMDYQAIVVKTIANDLKVMYRGHLVTVLGAITVVIFL